ncbi:LSD1 zinc finger family protein [Rhynchospora pubera]|uniref:LSD1 zinc finger family protein n=1 Tax=Rhynchospora pubera TaxID=906938 RepID=A0AAV8H5L0_9POAL|nr:LSD1 zinc finger family protein [Rhynchospora pubera]
MERFAQSLLKGTGDLMSRIVSESMDLVNGIFSNEPVRMHNRIVCSGCRTLLIYPAGAATVQCGACNIITAVYPQGGMDQIVCSGCRTPLMYYRGATSVSCACCQTVTPVSAGNNTSLVNCGHCNTLLMFPRGAESVRCSRCNYVTDITSGTGSIATAGPRPTELTQAQAPITATQASPQASNVTVVVENPMTVDEEGKLVSNVAVGIASGKK